MPQPGAEIAATQTAQVMLPQIEASLDQMFRNAFPGMPASPVPPSPGSLADTTPDAQSDASSHPSGLDGGDPAHGQRLPSNMADRDAFVGALGLLNDTLNAPDNLTAHHGSFSLDTVKTVATMPLDDPRWENNTLFGQAIPTTQRQAIQDAATTVLLPDNAPALGEVVGSSGEFNDAGITSWLAKEADTTRQGDGRIDSFHQGKYGDCFLLSAIGAVSNTPEGRTKIQNSISCQHGVYSIQFSGDPDKTVFTVTQAEVDQAQQNGNWSAGDADMTAFELGIEKYDKLHGKTVTRGGFAGDILSLITGRKKTETSNPIANAALIRQAAADPDGFTMTLGSGVTKDGRPVAFSDPASVGNHSFSVTAIDPSTGMATVENPWDTTKPHAISITDLARFGYLDYLPGLTGTAAARAAQNNARSAADAAAQWDAEAYAQTAITYGGNVDGKQAMAAANAAQTAADQAAESARQAQLAAAVAGAGPDAANEAANAVASAKDAQAAAARATSQAKNIAREGSNASSDGVVI